LVPLQTLTSPHPLASLGHIRLSYQPPANSTFLSEETNHQQSASSTFFSKQISTSHQSSAKRTDTSTVWSWNRRDQLESKSFYKEKLK
jgi:hypothetical protein